MWNNSHLHVHAELSSPHETPPGRLIQIVSLNRLGISSRHLPTLTGTVPIANSLRNGTVPPIWFNCAGGGSRARRE